MRLCRQWVDALHPAEADHAGYPLRGLHTIGRTLGAMHGLRLRRLAPKLQGPEITLTYVSGRLFLDNTNISAREG
jgi:hypothetical protein